MIGIKEINDYINLQEQSKQNYRFKSLHLSELAICGFKYRHAIDNKLPIKFKWSYEIGNVFEWKLTRYLMEIDKSIIASPKQFTVKYNLPKEFKEYGTEVIGHLDAYSQENDLAYEIKTTKSNNQNDIYERQLFAYMFAGNIHYGKLIKYNKIFDSITETTYQLPLIKDKIYKLLEKQSEAFLENKYINGIDNSICQYCENVDCPVRYLK